MDPTPPLQQPSSFGFQVNVQTSPVSVAPTHVNAEEMKRIYSLIDRDRSFHKSVVRNVAEAFLARDATRIEMLHPIIMALTRPANHRRSERQLAVWLLGSAQLTQEQREFATNTLIKVMERKMEPEAGVRFKRSVLLALLPAFFLTSFDVFDDPHFPVGIFALLCVFTPLLYGISTVRDLNASSHICAEAATALGKLRALESLDVLVANAQNPRRRRKRSQRQVARAAAMALCQVLPMIGVEQEGQVRAETINGLCRLLHIGDEDLVVAILRSFIYIGNAQAVTVVQKLAAGEGRAGREPRVHQAAQQCLPMIQARIAREHDPHVLLRPSSSPVTPVDQLLRPAVDATPIDPMQLLRSCSDPEWKGSDQEITLIVQILNHLEQHGDARALSYVEQVLTTPNIDSRILSAANACLPVLRAHEELERYSPRQDSMVNIQSNRTA